MSGDVCAERRGEPRRASGCGCDLGLIWTMAVVDVVDVVLAAVIEGVFEAYS